MWPCNHYYMHGGCSGVATACTNLCVAGQAASRDDHVELVGLSQGLPYASRGGEDTTAPVDLKRAAVVTH